MRKHFRIGKGTIHFYSTTTSHGRVLVLKGQGAETRIKVKESDLEVFIDDLNKKRRG